MSQTTLLFLLTRRPKKNRKVLQRMYIYQVSFPMSTRPKVTVHLLYNGHKTTKGIQEGPNAHIWRYPDPLKVTAKMTIAGLACPHPPGTPRQIEWRIRSTTACHVNDVGTFCYTDSVKRPTSCPCVTLTLTRRCSRIRARLFWTAGRKSSGSLRWTKTSSWWSSLATTVF